MRSGEVEWDVIARCEVEQTEDGEEVQFRVRKVMSWAMWRGGKLETKEGERRDLVDSRRICGEMVVSSAGNATNTRLPPSPVTFRNKEDPETHTPCPAPKLQIAQLEEERRGKKLTVIPAFSLAHLLDSNTDVT